MSTPLQDKIQRMLKYDKLTLEARQLIEFAASLESGEKTLHEIRKELD